MCGCVRGFFGFVFFVCVFNRSTFPRKGQIIDSACKEKQLPSVTYAKLDTKHSVTYVISRISFDGFAIFIEKDDAASDKERQISQHWQKSS